MKNLDIDVAISKLPQDLGSQPVFIHKSIFDEFLYYQNGKFYEGKGFKHEEEIKPRSEGVPSESEFNLVAERIEEKYAPKYVFNLRSYTRYGYWVAGGYVVKKPKQISKEYAQICVDVYFGDKN